MKFNRFSLKKKNSEKKMYEKRLDFSAFIFSNNINIHLFKMSFIILEHLQRHFSNNNLKQFFITNEFMCFFDLVLVTVHNYHWQSTLSQILKYFYYVVYFFLPFFSERVSQLILLALAI